VTSNVDDPDTAKSLALRLLIHYIGDVHQPLHAESRVDDEFPDGDRGGNDFPLSSSDPAEDYSLNLHSLWDEVIKEFKKSPDLPFDSDSWSTLGDTAEDLKSSYNIDPSEVDLEDFIKWAKESFEIAESSAYVDIQEDDPVSDDYIATNRPLAEKQIVLAGMRLAHVMADIFGSSTDDGCGCGCVKAKLDAPKSVV